MGDSAGGYELGATCGTTPCTAQPECEPHREASHLSTLLPEASAEAADGPTGQGLAALDLRPGRARARRHPGSRTPRAATLLVAAFALAFAFALALALAPRGCLKTSGTRSTDHRSPTIGLM